MLVSDRDVKRECAVVRYDPGDLDAIIEVLETTRSRLAVAAAADSKSMPPGQREDCLEIDRRLRRCLRNLRSLHRSGPSGLLPWREGAAAMQCLRDSSLFEKGQARL